LQRLDQQLTELSRSQTPSANIILDIPPEYSIGSVKNPIELGLPPLPLRNALLSLYFKYCWETNAIVIPSLFRLKLAKHDVISPPLGHKDWIDFHVLLFMILARAAKVTANNEFCPSGNRFQDQGSCFVQVAHTLLENCQNKPTINLIQALLEMCSFEQNHPKRFRCIMFAGMAIRCMFKLGLHKQPDDSKLSPVEKKERQLIFWICHLRDVETALNLQTPYKIDLSQCSVPMLEITDEEGFEKRGFEWLISVNKLVMIARQFWEIPENDRQLRKIGITDVVELERQMTGWLQELPSDLQYRGGAKRSVDCMRLHVNFFFIKMITYQMFAEKFRTDPDPVEEDILFVYEQCILAAHGITQLYIEGDIAWMFWHNFHYVAILQCLDMHMRDVRVAMHRGTGIADAFCWLTKSTHLICEALYDRSLMELDEATLIFDDILRFWATAAKLIDTPSKDFVNTIQLLDTCFPEKEDRKYIVISVEPIQTQDKGSNSSVRPAPTTPAESNYLHMTRRYLKLLPEEVALNEEKVA
jgi:hypothetical protein